MIDALNFFFQTTDSLRDNVSSFTLQNKTPVQNLDSYAFAPPITSIILHCCLWPVVIICGIFGNIISMVVLGKMEDSSIMSIFLKSLTISDTVTLIIRCMQMVYIWGKLFWSDQMRTWQLSSFEINALCSLPYRISEAVAISVDRVIAVTMPFRYKIMCMPKRITLILVMMSVIITAMALPTIVDVFMYRFQVGENKTIYTDFGKQYRISLLSQSKWKSLLWLINILLFDVVPIPVVLICNVIISIYIRRSNIEKSITNQVRQQRKHKEMELTKLLLTISMLFLILVGPLAVSGVLIIAGALEEDKLVLEILQTLSLVNNSINFIVYSVMNKKYREGYLATLCCCRRNNAIEESIVLSTTRTERQ